MRSKFISSVMAGVYVSLGAIVFLSISNSMVASSFFALGIMLVINYRNMLLTRVVPLLFNGSDYTYRDIIISFFGNLIGTFSTAFLISYTRLADVINNKLSLIVDVKLNDNMLSLLIMGIFGGVLVAYASITSKRGEKGSFSTIFYVWLFVTSFVICGFDHVIANMFYFALHAFEHGFTLSIFYVTIVVFVGNFIGGMAIGLIERNK